MPLILSLLFLAFLGIGLKNVLSGNFKIDFETGNWIINSDGIFKNGSNEKINCNEMQLGNFSNENGFLVKNTSDTKLLLMVEDAIYTSNKTAFDSISYTSDSFSKSFVIKNDDDDVLVYVDNDGLHYKSSLCLQTNCGDGAIEGDEECDDGNIISGDGCSASCLTEIYNISMCGDGVKFPGREQCDDGNSNNSDYCLSSCKLASCGDGYVHINPFGDERVFEECGEPDLEECSDGYECSDCKCEVESAQDSCTSNADCREEYFCGESCICTLWAQGMYVPEMSDEVVGDNLLSCESFWGVRGGSIPPERPDYCAYKEEGISPQLVWWGLCWRTSEYCSFDGCVCKERDLVSRPDNACGGGDGCFQAGTKIATPKGYVDIENIKQGDLVYSYDESNDKVVESKVVKLWIHEDYRDPAVVMTLSNGIELNVTLNHPFYDLSTGKYKNLSEFNLGDQLMVYNNFTGDLEKLNIVSMQKTDYFYYEYNLHLEGPNNFFANGVIVHNAIDDGTKGDPDDPEESDDSSSGSSL